MASSLPVVFLMGPTASGKTAIAVELAQRFPVELVSVDSALVYQDMNIGTAKPDAATLERAPHHLIDIIDPTEAYSAAQFRADALKLIDQIHARGRIPVLVGGTMLYFNALQHGLHDLPQADPVVRAALDQDALNSGWPAMHARLAQLDPTTAARLHPTDSQRVQRALEIAICTGKPMSEWLAEQRDISLSWPLIKYALLPSDRSVLHQRIELRFAQMIEFGLIEEVCRLQQKYILSDSMSSMRCVGYRQTLAYLAGKISEKELFDQGVFATRQLAKRQLTWLRGMEDIRTFDCIDPDCCSQLIDELSVKIVIR